MVSRCIIGGIVAVSVMLAAVPVQADITLNVRGSDGLNSTLRVRNGNGRISADGRAEYLLYDSRNGIVTYVEPQQRQYTQLTAAELEATVQTATSLKQSMAPYMTNLLAGLPAEQRNMIEQRMGSILDAPAAGTPLNSASFRTVDRGRHTIAGLRCQASGILKNGRPAAEVCMMTAADGKLSNRDFATLEALVVFSRSMAGTASSLLGSMAEPFELLATELDGVPIAVRDIEHNKQYQVTAVSNATLSDAYFNSYGRFQKQTMASLFR
ncbi:MAG: hypothetical protein WBP44_00145 [Gammaproteobacteria bacterium]